MSQPLRREWFLNSATARRLMAPLPSGFAEVRRLGVNFLRHYWVGLQRGLVTGSSPCRRTPALTHLTQSNRRNAGGSHYVAATRPPRLCRTCGAALPQATAAPARFLSARGTGQSGTKGRLASHGSEAEAKRAENRRRHAGLKARRPSDQPAWLDQETYLRKIRLGYVRDSPSH